MSEGEASSSTNISPVKVVQSTQPSSSNVSSAHDVVGIWDFESSKLPHHYPTRNLKPNIQNALQQYNPNLVLKKVVAVGPGKGRRYDKINSLSQEFEMIRIPQETMFCDMPDCVTPDPVVPGVDPSQERIMRKTDIADKYAMLRMYMEACTTPNILVISSDADFIDAIYRMITQGGICVMAAVEGRFDLNTLFLNVPEATWIWRSDNPNEDTMIRNGRGLVREGYQLPAG